MKNFSESEIAEIEKVQVKDNSEAAYWSKRYDISVEDLKNKNPRTGIYDKIVQSFIQKTN